MCHQSIIIYIRPLIQKNVNFMSISLYLHAYATCQASLSILDQMSSKSELVPRAVIIGTLVSIMDTWDDIHITWQLTNLPETRGLKLKHQRPQTGLKLIQLFTFSQVYLYQQITGSEKIRNAHLTNQGHGCMCAEPRELDPDEDTLPCTGEH